MWPCPRANIRLPSPLAQRPCAARPGWISVLAWIALAVTAAIVSRPIAGDESSQDGDLPTAWPAIVGTAAVAGIVVALAATQPQLLRLHSPPDAASPAGIPLRVDFADEIRLLGIDPPPDTVRPGDAVHVSGYLRALTDVDSDYTVFLHLDDPISGKTIATVDQSHPGGIPTSDWATGLYVRSPLKLTVPPDADPIQYALRLGLVRPAHRRPAAAHRRQRGPIRGRSHLGQIRQTGAHTRGIGRPLWRPHRVARRRHLGRGTDPALAQRTRPYSRTIPSSCIFSTRTATCSGNWTARPTPTATRPAHGVPANIIEDRRPLVGRRPRPRADRPHRRRPLRPGHRRTPPRRRLQRQSPPERRPHPLGAAPSPFGCGRLLHPLTWLPCHE